MEREILFRGKRDPHYGKGWCYGVPYTDHEGDCIIATHNSQMVVIEKTVGQYTGLTDKNGVKIFEGDILKGFGYPFYSDGEFNYFAEVIWFDNSPAFGISLFKNSESNVRDVSDGLLYYLEDFNSDDYEVIGNVFDNPEQLKGESNA